MKSAAALLAVTAVLVSGCSSPAPSDDAVARLQIDVSLGDLGGATRSSELVCRTDIVSGTGYLAFDQLASKACRHVTRNGEVARFLVRGPSGGRACPEIYGGPQTARITGTVGGERVDRSIDRTDGCGIDDWALLEPLLGPP